MRSAMCQPRASKVILFRKSVLSLGSQCPICCRRIDFGHGCGLLLATNGGAVGMALGVARMAAAESSARFVLAPP